MAWIKRNLFFVIGSVIALALMVAGGFYLFSEISTEGKLATDFQQQQGELTSLNNQNPHPGYGSIDNIKAAKEQTAGIRAYITKTRPFFTPIPPIPDMGGAKIGNADFATALRLTITELQHSAEQQSVLLTTSNYYFSFEAQKKIMNFDPASLDKLAVQLGEVKAICEVLFAAKVNSLDYIRRESVSADDKNPSDYIPQKTTSTPLGDLSPYEVKFHCFSADLAAVLSSLASSHNGFIVKTINVEPTLAGPEDLNNPSGPPPTTIMPQIRPGYYNDPRLARMSEGRLIAPPPTAAPAAPVVSTKPQNFLAEKLFTVTTRIDVIKVKETKDAKAAK